MPEEGPVVRSKGIVSARQSMPLTDSVTERHNSRRQPGSIVECSTMGITRALKSQFPTPHREHEHGGPSSVG
jgi:hypothetical protein